MVLSLAGGLLAFSGSLLAADGTYTGAATSGLDTTTNWSSSSVPASTTTTSDTATFNGTTSGALVLTEAVANTFGGASGTLGTLFNVTSGQTGTITIGGQSIRLAGVTNASGAAVTFNNTVVFGGATAASTNIINSTSGSLLTFGAIQPGGAALRTLDFTGTGAVTISGIIGGNGNAVAIQKDTTGILTLSGANTYTGATALNAGVTKINNATALGTTAGATTVASGATLQILTGGLTVAENITISGVGASGESGALDSASGTTTYSGLVTLGAASTIGAGSSTTLNLTNAGTITGSGFTLTLNGGGTGSVASIIGTGAGGLIKNGTGTWTLTGANTYTGGTTVNQGTLTVGTGGALGATTSALIVGNNNTTAAGTATILNLATAANTTTGSLSGGISTPTSGTNTATINTGGSGINFTVNQTGSGTYAGVIAGAGNFTLGSLTTNTLTLSGANTYTGATTVSAGKLTIASTGTINTTSGVSIGAGEFNYNSSTALSPAISFSSTGGTLSGTGTITPAVTVTSGNTLAPGNGVGTLAITGGLTLASGSASNFELGTPGTSHASVGTSDKVVVGGALALGGTLTLTDSGSAGAGPYKIFTQVGAATGSFSSVPTIGTGSSQLRAKVDASTAGSVFVDAYRVAAAAASQTVNIATRVNVAGTSGVSLANANNATAPYQETLGTTGFTGTTSGFTATGAATGIAGGSSGGGTLAVGGTFATSGVHSGSATLGLQTEAVNSSGLGTLAISGQTVNINVTVYDLAKPVFAQVSGDGSLSGSGTSYTLAFGSGLIAGQTYTANLTLTNQQISSTYQDSLSGGYAKTGDAEFSQTGTSFSGLAVNGSQSFSIVFTALSSGNYSGTVTLGSLLSSTSGLSDAALSDINIAISASVSAVPEPSTYACLAGAAALGIVMLRRRRR